MLTKGIGRKVGDVCLDSKAFTRGQYTQPALSQPDRITAGSTREIECESVSWQVPFKFDQTLAHSRLGIAALGMSAIPARALS